MENKKHESKEIDVLKQEIENLKLKQSQLLGKDLNGVGLKEVLELEQQLNQALISIKNKKEQILMNQLERAKVKEQQMKLENNTLREQVQELRGKIHPNGNVQQLNLEYHSELESPVENYGIGSGDSICNDDVENEYSDTTLHLGPPSGICGKRKARGGESQCTHSASRM
ncbi:hypothetical protein Leryth_013148 [Lithospermum erythrorhizon]|nr:hypothetical protein Leryth_013148 [Lithospermum erythrorhizon]